jgi:DNA helicase-2/ATP-dependent DNA helicase PcrA
VLAGAGSGKTRVITHRLARLVETGVDPRAILAVTFTNKAAEEMRERARALLGGGIVLSFIGTSTRGRCASAAVRGRGRRPPRFAIADAADQLALVKEAMAELQISDQVLPPGAVRARISSAKNALVTAKKFEETQTDFAGERIARVYLLYEKKLAAAGALDFDDLIARSVRLLRERPDILGAERRRVRHLLIDEYQDTPTRRRTPWSSSLGKAPSPSAPSATRTRRSTAGGAPRSSTSCASTRTSPARAPSRWRRTTGRPTGSCAPPRPSSRTTGAAA